MKKKAVGYIRVLTAHQISEYLKQKNIINKKGGRWFAQAVKNVINYQTNLKPRNLDENQFKIESFKAILT